ncbi:bifunctional DNA-formamidopyrimidine glycosylase/DNA-(apurinic or apyrimidinic site) lyase [Candidatus Nephthysia bennettiae]|uniref:Formamidopyrimidine-DNA glycosylase n=1 Tax=Candidatus Nephthysia bennettiae TaxID=3127016 RepID=A0A934N175_9BACT|nr:bifunctional DNA-formamidopyrimidine glycosylase/DNA-(apurinic or apyrimidinic site) lyase [Candidatus Dormibacteraeota bacterium]MBJ7611810.1 bifunctional DNA-formamidopyrimidine glycosylase/DNA-(apurinic or apyrimidinic site) lyase [Candidatus Dormibacteraeota bacterium]
MPELPEVETVTADLRPHVVGRTIVGCDLRFPAIVRHPSPAAFAAGLTARRVEAMSRRGKYILHHLDSGELLVVHLGMTGQWRYVAADTAEPDHLHAVLTLDDGFQLRYRDVRRFGRLLLGSEQELVGDRKMPRLGPEPIDPTFTATDLYRRLHVRRAPLKALLLDQMVVAGVGNIYADEACFRARVRPDRAANTLSRQAVGRLREALDESLRRAIVNRGSSVSDYRDAWGEAGRQQEELQVYGRGGQPCLRCGRPLALVRLAGRSTVFCRRCQR